MEIANKFFINFKNKIFKNDFNKNVLILSGGTFIAQILPVAVSPILSRMYSPSDFGVFALFVSIASIISVIATGTYEFAIMLPEKDEDAINVAAVAFIFNIAVSLLFLLIVLLFKNPILKLLKAGSLSFWIYFAPLTVFFTGLFAILNYTNNRFKLYKDISEAAILKGIVLSSIQLIMGLFKTGPFGLISGQIISQSVGNTKLFLNIKNRNLLKQIKKDKIKEIAKRYSNFPKYSLWGALLKVSGYQITNMLIGAFFGPYYLGQYYMAFRILDIPTTFIGSAIAQVFFKEATEELQNTGRVINTFRSTLKKLLIISIPTFSIIFIFVKPLFPVIFGQSWKDAGLYAMILSPFWGIRFISSSLSLTIIIYEKNKIYTLYNLLINLINILAVVMFRNLIHFVFFIIFISVCLSLLYLILLIYFYKLSIKEKIIKNRKVR